MRIHEPGGLQVLAERPVRRIEKAHCPSNHTMQYPLSSSHSIAVQFGMAMQRNWQAPQSPFCSSRIAYSTFSV